MSKPATWLIGKNKTACNTTDAQRSIASHKANCMRFIPKKIADQAAFKTSDTT